jgi:cobalt transporter subunit CbtA
MWVALLSGSLSGGVLFVLRHWTVAPLIAAAEVYEEKRRAPHAAEPQSGSLHESADQNLKDQKETSGSEGEGWEPSSPLERNTLTALSTILLGIGFSSLLFGCAALAGVPLDWKRGCLWGLAGFACCVLAPAIGLPPEPPGAVAAALQERQIWWFATVLATAIGLWLLVGGRRKLPLRIGGGVMVLLPHLIGAPVAAAESVVPLHLIHQFQVASIFTSAIFWLLVGFIGGWLHDLLDKGFREC